LEESPEVLVIILNWNGTEDTLRCLESLRQVEYDNFDVLVIDNGSVPGSTDPIKRDFPEVSLIRNEQNLGFSGGNNVGLQYARDTGPKYVLILNNDTTIDPHFVTELVKVAETDPRIAVVGGKVIQFEKPDRLWAVYGAVNFCQQLVKVWGYNKPITRFASQKDVDFVVGCGMMFSMKAVADVGEFDELFFAYHDEVDWCKRARDKGYRAVYVPGALMWHKGCASTGGFTSYYNPALRYLVARNSVLYVKKYARPHEWIKFIAILAASLPVGFLRKAVTCNLRGYRMRLRGVCAGFTGSEIPFEELGLR
jgi:GT2 family glycosyltransferase